MGNFALSLHQSIFIIFNADTLLPHFATAPPQFPPDLPDAKHIRMNVRLDLIA